MLRRKPKTGVARLTGEIVDVLNANVRHPMEEIIGALRFIGRLRFKSAASERLVAEMLRTQLLPPLQKGLSEAQALFLPEVLSELPKLKRDLRAIADMDVPEETLGGDAPWT